MIKKSLVMGILVGMVLTVLLLYPTYSLLVVRMANTAGIPLQTISSELRLGVVQVSVSLLVTLACTSLFTLTVLVLGPAAVLRSGAYDLRPGAISGGVAGASAGVTIYIMLLCPTNAILAARSIFQYNHLYRSIQTYPETMVVEFARAVLLDSLTYILITVLALIVVGALEGALTGWLLRSRNPEQKQLTLLDILPTRRDHRRWYRFSEDVFLSGLTVGVLVGILLLLTNIWKTAYLQADTPEGALLMSTLQQALAGTHLDNILQKSAFSFLTPFVFLATGLAGLVAALLPKDPPKRFHSRVQAAIIAGTTVGIVMSILIIASEQFSVALFPQTLPLQTGSGPAAFSAADLEMLARPPVRVLIMYLLPLPTLLFITLACTLIGAVEGVVYGAILLAFQMRPVDRAYRILRETVRHPDLTLPRLYHVFQADCAAPQTLAHLYFYWGSMPDRSQMVAAYHTLATAPERTPEALQTITTILDAHPDWKMRAEISALHRIFSLGLAARSLSQVAAIHPMPETQTSSLPSTLARIGEHLTRILCELKKVERVDDLSAKIIFLNNSLENLRMARLFCEMGERASGCQSPYPELGVLRRLLDQWEATVLSSIKDLQGSADLSAQLVTRRFTYETRLNLTIAIRNQGLNVAEAVRILVSGQPGEYEVVETKIPAIEILTPQEQCEVTFTIKPLVKAPMRIEWQVLFRDTLNPERALEFADQIEFLEEEKPFQRIFPIPYVTGTPLQSRQLFVGRQDVFTFVHEQLLGAYQNNVIVLHGQRRTGKSSILYQLNTVMADTHYCVLIDMQGKAARGEADFLYSIADDIAYALENHGIQIDLPERKDFEESPEFFFRNRFLRGVTAHLGDKNLLLMFDEFEELQKRVEDGKLGADIFPYLRNLMQHETRVDFVFAGTHKLEELAAEYWSILFNIAAYKRITFLSKEEVTRLMTQPVQPYGLEYDPLVVERVYQVAAGHPYFTQVVCHEMVVYHNETQRSYLTVTCLDAVLDRIIERGEAHFKYIWAESATHQRLILLALAELLEIKDSVTIEDIAAQLEKRGRPLSGEELAQAASELEARDILSRAGPRSNLYRFSVDLIRRWIYATRPSYAKVL